MRKTLSLYASMLFAVIFTGTSGMAQTRTLGTFALQLDNNSGSKITLKTPSTGWINNLNFILPIPPAPDVQSGFVYHGSSPNQTLRFDGDFWQASNILINDGTNITVAGDILPNITSVRNLGSPTLRFNNVYVDNFVLTPGSMSPSTIALPQGNIIVGNAANQGSAVPPGAANMVPISNGTTIAYGFINSGSLNLNQGSIFVGDAAGKASQVAIGVANTVPISNGTTLGYGQITNASVSNFAGILGSKIVPDFGSQNITTTGKATTAATLVGDPATTLTTKGYVEGLLAAPGAIQPSSIALPLGNIIVGNAANQGSAVAPGGAGTVPISNGTTVAYGQITNAGVSNTAAILGSKIVPDFGAQVITTTGKATTAATVAGDAASTLTTKGYVDNLVASPGTIPPSSIALPLGNIIVGNAAGQGAAVAPGLVNTVPISNGTTLAYGLLTNSNISSTAAIAGTKISPDFGGQNITTTGKATSAATVGGDAATTLTTKGYVDGIFLIPGNIPPSSLSLNQGSIIIGNAANQGSALAIGAANTIPVSNGTTLAYGLLSNLNISNTAAIAGTKINPDFGSQNITTTGKATTAATVAADPATTLTTKGYVDASHTTPGAIPPSSIALPLGSIIVGNASNQGAAVAIGAVNAVPISNGTTLAYGLLSNGSISNTAAIAGSKINPDFGTQSITTSGKATTASTAPADVPTTLTTKNYVDALLTTPGNIQPSSIALPLGNIIVGNASGQGSAVAPGTANTVPVSNGTTLSYLLISNANISNTAAIAGSKINPDFGTQAITTTGKATTAATLPADPATTLTTKGYVDGLLTTPGAMTPSSIALPQGNIIVGSASNVGSAVAAGVANTLPISNGTTLAYGQIANANVSNTAAIAGSKINPDFGTQAITTTGKATTAATLPADPAATLTTKGYVDGLLTAPGGIQPSSIALPQGNIIVGNASNVGSAVAPGAANTLPISDGTTLAYGQIANANVSNTAAIAGSKINPDFGAQNITTTGKATTASTVLADPATTLTTKDYVDAGAAGAIGNAVILAPATSARNVVQATANATELTLKQATGQTANLMEFQNSAGTSVASVTTDGKAKVTGLLGAGGGNYAGNVACTIGNATEVINYAGVQANSVILVTFSDLTGVDNFTVSITNINPGVSFSVSFSGAVTSASASLNYMVINP